MIKFAVENDEASTLNATNPTVIKIIGCGGGGSSAVNRIIDSGVTDVEYIVMNTDLQALKISHAEKKLPIGQKLTGGLGAGGNPAVGENSAKEDKDMITGVIDGANMVIITAGMGGGTGTGSAPVVAEIAKESGALTIAVVTTPFDFEGPVRMKNALDGLKKLKENVDSLIVIPNEQLMKVVNKQLTFKQAFGLADDVLCQGVKGISEIITKPGDVNLDFADVKSVMQNQGEAILGVGIGEGENRAVDAAQNAISNPLLENRQIDGASKILINITSDGNLGMAETQEIVNNIRASASKNVEIFFGLVTDPAMGDKVSVTVIATGFNTAGGISDAFEEQEEEQDNGNIIDYGTFESLMGGKSSVVQQPEPVAEPTRTSSVIGGMNFNRQFASLEEAETEAPAKEDVGALERALRSAQNTSSRGIEPPSGFKAKSDDINQPACWRNLDGLSRSIDFTQE